MSFKEVGWVLDHSPYKLAGRLVHIVLAERANEDNGRELWYSVQVIADKTGVSRRTVTNTLAAMVEDGYLEVIEEPVGRPTRYRFLMPTQADFAQGGQAIQRGEPVQSGDGDLLLPKEDKNTIAAHFARFYAIYPKRVGRDGAARAFERALKRAPLETIIAGAVRYRDDPRRSAQFTKHPATWLNQGCWDDELGPVAATGGTVSTPDDWEAPDYDPHPFEPGPIPTLCRVCEMVEGIDLHE